MIEISPAMQLGESYRRQITEVYADAFGSDFAYFSKDTQKLTDAFQHMLVLDLFYVALVDGKPAGIAACTDGRQQSVRHDGKELRRHLGLFKGTIANIVFRREFQGVSPEAKEGLASIEFVATAARYQGQGVATTLLKHLLALPQYNEYVLEDISDINTSALKVYEKLGFTEYKRRKVNHTKKTGINYYLSMKLVQSPDTTDAAGEIDAC